MEAEDLIDDVDPEDLLKRLRDWQQQQQNRLAQQQQQQRQILLQQQSQLLSKLGSPRVEVDEKIAVPEKSADESLDIVEVKAKQWKKSTARHTTVDEMPLKKPRTVKTFQQLLETSLPVSDPPPDEKANHGQKKFSFLKRGQGISRFGQISFPVKRQAPVKKLVKKGKENQFPAATSNNKIVTREIKAKEPIPKQQAKASEPEPLVSSLRALAAPVHVEDELPIEIEEVAPVSTPEERAAKSSREEEDLAVFELLEKFATINASFSSTSSFIGQLIDKGVTSLPSPSKVIDFLAKKGHIEAPSNVCQDQGPKPLKNDRHVRFADDLEVDDSSILYNKPWLNRIEEESIDPASPCEPRSSPFVSNTCIGGRHHFYDPAPSSAQLDFDETPASPIGFPDMRRLLAESPSSLEDIPNDNLRKFDGKALASVEAPPSKETKDSTSSAALPIDDPQTVYHTSLLRSRLLSLEREIANYRRENESLRRARKQLDDSKLRLEQEQEKFRRYTDNEKRRMQLLFSEEQKRARAEQLKDIVTSQGSEVEIAKLKEEISRLKEEHRGKETKWMANQTKLQERVRVLELANRQLTDNVDKLRSEEQQLRRRLNASLRPGALMKNAASGTNNVQLATEVDEKADDLKADQPQADIIAVVDNCSSKAASDSAQNNKRVEEQPVQVPAERAVSVASASNTVLPDGTRLILYPNGNRKEIWPGNKGVQVIYYNGDIKQKLADGTIVYTYADTGTKHTTKGDGTDILEFTSGQIEMKFPDGRVQVHYPEGAVKTKYPDGREEAQWPDGTKLWSDGKGHGVMTAPTGVREIYTPICKRREYPDGTVKTVYEDGRSETRYSNGRIRVKDSQGNVITDTAAGQSPVVKCTQSK